MRWPLSIDVVVLFIKNGFNIKNIIYFIDVYRAISNEWLANTAFKIEKIISSTEMQTVKS